MSTGVDLKNFRVISKQLSKSSISAPTSCRSSVLWQLHLHPIRDDVKGCSCRCRCQHKIKSQFLPKLSTPAHLHNHMEREKKHN